MKQVLQIKVDIPSLTPGKFINKLTQSIEVDSSLDIDFNSLIQTFRFLYGLNAIISFVLMDYGKV